MKKFDKAIVKSIEKWTELNGKENRIVLTVNQEYPVSGKKTDYFLDITEDLKKHSITYDSDIEQLRETLPEYVYASFSEVEF